jgi:hypothetical protein
VEPAARRRPTAAAPTPLAEICGALAILVPFAVTAMAARALASWHTDAALIRALGFTPLGNEGFVSATLAQLMRLLPIGNQVLRVAFLGALAAGVAGGLLYDLTRLLLARHRAAPRLAPPLATCAALIGTLGPSWQADAAAPGGQVVAAALALAGVRIAADENLGARAWASLGVLGALTAAESPLTAGALMMTVLVLTVTRGTLPRPRDLLLLGALGAVSAGLLAAPMWAARLAAPGMSELGSTGISLRPMTALGSVAEGSFLAPWTMELGLLACALAVLGAAGGLSRPRTRAITAGLVGLIAMDALGRALPGELLQARGALPLLAIGALAVVMALAVFGLALLLVELRVRFAETAAVLLVVFTFTLVLVTIDRAEPPPPRNRTSPAEVWTVGALAELPAHSLVLVRTPQVAQRLWAARIIAGSRPDVVVVPLPWLDRPSLVAHLLELEPGLAELIREVAVHGSPSEYALSTLADARPLFAELDPRWDRRLVEHLVPRSPWFGIAPHALGRSDRQATLEGNRTAFRRVLSAAKRGPRADAVTLALLDHQARQHATVLAALGDRESLPAILGDLRAIDPEHPFAAELESRLGKGRRSVDMRALLE